MRKPLLWGVLPALVLIAIPLPWWQKMPDPVAVHWNLAGDPDGSLPKAVAVAFPVVLWAAVVLFGRRLTPVAAGLGALVLLLQGLTVWANAGRADWHDARPLAPWVPVLLIAVPLLAGWAGARLAGPPDVPARPPETLDVPPGERAVWVSRCTNHLLLALGYLFLVLGVIMLLVGGQGGAAAPPVLLLVGLVGVLFSTIRVQVSERGVAVAYGPWAFPVWRRRLSRIAAARTEEVRPLEVGGWGLRGLPGRATLMLRGGECLVLDYPGGGRFAISVDDAARGAALINTLKTTVP